MIQNEKVNIYYGSKDAYDFEKQNKRIDENALYFIEGVLYSGYELYSQDYKKVSSYPSIGQKNCIYINTTDSSVAIWDDDKNEWIYLCMPASNEIINNSNSIATSSAVYKVLQNTKEYTDKKCNEMSESLTDTLNTAIENSIVDYNKNLFAESDKYNSISDIENAIDDITNRESVLQFSIEEEKNRAITAESEVKNTIETNKPIWDDKYTKVEIDNKFSAFETNIDWKEAVDTYSKIATTYPNAEDGWTVNVKDTDYTYRYNGTEWVTISANAIPKATNDVDGLLSKEDHAKYEEAYSQKHSHSNKSILDTITSTLIDAWNSAVTHISDTVKHITSNERTLWNTVSNKADSNHTHKYAGSSSAGGAATTALECTGNAATATKATQDASGNNIINTYATKSNPVLTGTFSHNRVSGSTSGEDSFAAGSQSTASGQYSVVIGRKSVASGAGAMAFGYAATSTGITSAAIGNTVTAKGDASLAIGQGTIASGDKSVAIGWKTESLDYQFAIGHHNNISTATGSTHSGSGTGTVFVIGNGSVDSKSNAFRVQGDGKVYAQGAYSATGADYAEYAEWADGNESAEDRRGYFVTFDEENPTKIRKANACEYILGIVSGNPCIIGNGDEDWRGRYIFDEFGAFILEEIEEEIEEIDAKTGELVKQTITITKYKENPDYDNTQEYVTRAERQEWAAVGWIGVLSVRDDGTCKVGGYCTVADGGIATASERGIDSYRVIERATDNIVKVVLK